MLFFLDSEFGEQVEQGWDGWVKVDGSKRGTSKHGGAVAADSAPQAPSWAAIAALNAPHTPVYEVQYAPLRPHNKCHKAHPKLSDSLYTSPPCCRKVVEPYENSFPPLQSTGSKPVKADSGVDLQCSSPVASDRSCAATPVMSWKDTDSVHSNDSGGQLDPYRLPFDVSEAKQQVCEDELLLEAAHPWCTLAHVQQPMRPMQPHHFQPVHNTVEHEFLPPWQVYTRVSGPPPQHIQSLFSLPSILSC